MKNEEFMKILNITTHMGGGAGNAISDIMIHDVKNSHCLICIMKPEKKHYIKRCEENGIDVFERPSRELVESKLQSADIVVLHWWNHPLMCQFLAEFPRIPCRIILWSHISGCTYPVLKANFIKLFCHVFFTTPFSLENTEWTKEERSYIQKNAGVVYGLGNFMDMRKKNEKKKDKYFYVGYVGTLGNAKLHPDFVDYCIYTIRKIENVKFILVGDTYDSDWIKNEIKKQNVEEYFEFTGFCEDVATQLERMDVFAYPLNHRHFGTTENVVLEAMMMELPVVLLNQNTEKYIVKHMETGFLVDGKEEYAQTILELYHSNSLREKIGKNARKSVLEKYNMEKNLQQFQYGLEKCMIEKKRLVDFKPVCGTKPIDWFLNGLSVLEKETFQSALSEDEDERNTAIPKIRNCDFILKGNSKSSVIHFANSNPEDISLQKLKLIIANDEVIKQEGL